MVSLTDVVDMTITVDWNVETNKTKKQKRTGLTQCILVWNFAHFLSSVDFFY